MVRGAVKALGALLLKVAIVLGAISLLAFEVAFAKSTDFWEATQISEQHLKDFVNSENCYKTEANFLGCIAATDSLLRKQRQRLANDTAAGLPGFGKVVKNLGAIDIREYKAAPSDPNKSRRQLWLERSQEVDAINASWKNFYAKTSSKLAFENLLADALDVAGTKGRKRSIGNAINQYYLVAVDPHTYWAPSADLNNRAQASRSLVGFGLYIVNVQGRFALSPYDDGPAELAGIREDDFLVSVDGNSVSGWDLNELMKNLAGDAGTPAILEVERQNKTLSFTVTRAEYSVPNVSPKLIQNGTKKVGYIKVNSFSDNSTCKSFALAARALHKLGATDLILDLRDNGGGLLREALCMAYYYLPPGAKILSQIDPYTNKVVEEHTVRKTDIAESLYEHFSKRPLIILQNAFSASASEVLAGALGAYDRAIRVGERSYGKGTVQHPNFDLRDIGIVSYRTTSRFHFADGSSNQLYGLDADIVADFRPNMTEDDRFALREAEKYPNAILAAKKPKKHKHSVVTKVNTCIQDRGVVAQRSSQVADYQRLVALEVAACL